MAENNYESGHSGSDLDNATQWVKSNKETIETLIKTATATAYYSKVQIELTRKNGGKVNVNIPLADSSADTSGLMLAAEKRKLASIVMDDDYNLRNGGITLTFASTGEIKTSIFNVHLFKGEAFHILGLKPDSPKVSIYSSDGTFAQDVQYQKDGPAVATAETAVGIKQQGFSVKELSGGATQIKFYIK